MTAPDSARPFWETKRLSEMTKEEWESLCDGCARCCLLKLEDQDTRQVRYTAAVCKYLDGDTCTCTRYAERTRLVPNCVELDAQRAVEYEWLPRTCAYRTLAEGRQLEPWHPLRSGSRDTVHEAGISVRGKCLPETHVHPDGLEELVITWVGTSQTRPSG